MSETMLKVNDLQVDFLIGKDELTAVHDISFSVEKGHTLAIVGESGCGKSVTATALMRLHPKETSKISKGTIELEGQDILSLPEKEMRNIRGHKISMIFQDPMTALNPVHTIGKQIMEVYRTHNRSMSKKEAFEKGVEMLAQVGIPLPRQRMLEYPHQLSGGMRQRVMIAMALAPDPDVLVADEPTTALDVTIQAQILDLMRNLQKELHTAVILITHDMGVVTDMADEVVVMYAGEVVEYGTLQEIFDDPCHPYTRGLLKAIPRLDMDDSQELFVIDGVVPPISEYGTTCRFANRCPYACEACNDHTIPLHTVGGTHTVRCDRMDIVKAGGKVSIDE